MLDLEGPVKLLQLDRLYPRVVEILKRLSLENRSEKPWFYGPLLDASRGSMESPL